MPVQYRVGFIFSQVLGHVTHQKNLQRSVEADSSIIPWWLLLNSRESDLLDKLPLVKNHMPLRMSLRARSRIKSRQRIEPLDALFYHTQITAMLSMRLARQVPTVVSTDATPIDFAQIGAYHAGGKAREADRSGYKFRWNQRVFQSAAAVVSWSAWCKRSIVKDYGVPAERVAVIPAGVTLSQWELAAKAPQQGRKLRLLFVGADFGRKGGPVLLEAFNRFLADTCELDIVSKTAPQDLAGARVHRGLTPNSEPLRRLYADADVFVFPSQGDCTPLATVEAMASGLPVVGTRVGSIPEQVEHGKTGLIIDPVTPGTIADAIKALLADEPRRLTMGHAGYQRARDWYDGERNYGLVLSLLKQCVDAHRAGNTVASPASIGLPIPMPA